MAKLAESEGYEQTPDGMDIASRHTVGGEDSRSLTMPGCCLQVAKAGQILEKAFQVRRRRPDNFCTVSILS